MAVNRCFDTIVDDDLIAKGTIHGKFIKKICSNGYGEKKLNNEIQKDLREKFFLRKHCQKQRSGKGI